MNNPPLNIIEDNVISYYKSLTRALGGQIFEQKPIIWFTTGRRSLMRFNGVLGAYTSAQNLPEVVRPVFHHFFSNNLPFFWADFPPGAAPGLGEFLISHDVLLVAKGMPAMQRSLEDLPALDIPDEVEIIPAHTEQNQVEWLEVLMRGFPEPEDAREDLRQYLQHSLTESKSTWHHFLARWQGKPCAISTLLCAPQSGGIYHVATLPAYRGRGLGRALTLTAMQAAREIGYSSVVLFATPDGYPLYQKLDFETVVTADLYAWLGNAPT
jgi:ribosomal protein S18 acetylase RimI-like enzyme